MNVDVLNSLPSSLRTLKLSNVDKFIHSYKGTGDMIFASFGISDNSHPVSADLMKDIATFARKGLDISKPIYLMD